MALIVFWSQKSWSLASHHLVISKSRMLWPGTYIVLRLAINWNVHPLKSLAKKSRRSNAGCFQLQWRPLWKNGYIYYYDYVSFHAKIWVKNLWKMVTILEWLYKFACKNLSKKLFYFKKIVLHISSSELHNTEWVCPLIADYNPQHTQGFRDKDLFIAAI